MSERLPDINEMWPAFETRDKNAVDDMMKITWSRPISESDRLAFLENRVNDLASMIKYLYLYIEQNVDRKDA